MCALPESPELLLALEDAFSDLILPDADPAGGCDGEDDAAATAAAFNNSALSVDGQGNGDPPVGPFDPVEESGLELA